MDCCQCKGIEGVFNDASVAKELKSYRARGPKKTTQMMVEAIKEAGVEGLTLLDIGGGVGAVQHELLEAGAQKATDVDASQAYIHAAQEEAGRRGVAEKIEFFHGDFVDLADQIPPADVVTLDRVICCYHDMANMVSLSTKRAGKLYGLVFPRDEWWVKIGFRVINFFMRLQKNPFRVFPHPSRRVEELVKLSGLERRYYNHTLLWQVVVYAR